MLLFQHLAYGKVKVRHGHGGDLVMETCSIVMRPPRGTLPTAMAALTSSLERFQTRNIGRI